jgi:uncharacterized protein (UPF0548 family)
VAIRLRRPTAAQLAALLERCRAEPLTYTPIGGSLGGAVPAGLKRREWSTELAGAAAFERGRRAIRGWGVHRGAGLEVLPDGPLTVGTNVAISAPLPLGYVEITCRVVAIIDELDRFGFAYGTLPVHPETGEESFVISRGDHGARFDVRAVSRPVDPFARAFSLIASRLQDAAVRRYLSSMQRAVSTDA